MKRIMGRILAGAVFVLTIGLLTGCSDAGEVSYHDGESSVEDHYGEDVIVLDGDGNENAKALQNDERGEILLVERSTNHAWGHYDHGLFVDAQGKVYAYDFSRYPAYMPYDENALTFIERLELIRENCDEICSFDEKFVREVMELGGSLSPEDEFKKEEKMYDYGQNTLYFYQPKTQELLMVESTGDVDYTPKNKDAKKIARTYEKYTDLYAQPIANAAYAQGIPTVYSTDDVVMRNYVAEGADAWVGKWALETKAQLKAFAEQSGIPVDDVLADDNDPEYDGCTYFISVEAARQEESCGNPRGIWIHGNCIDFVSPDDTSVEEGKFVCYLAQIYKEDLTADDTDLVDLNGTAWKKN